VEEGDVSSTRSPLVDTACPIGRAATVVGDRWSLLILRHAMLGVTRFDEFKTELGIADNILSSRLGRLVENGLLIKKPYRAGRMRYEYRLTEAGADMLPVLNALAVWGARHSRPVELVAPMQILHTPCGSSLEVGMYCQCCARQAEHDEVAWLRPWRSPRPVRVAEPVD
jgi:DNA-binding HxlR family transcriptional regulator